MNQKTQSQVFLSSGKKSSAISPLFSSYSLALEADERPQGRNAQKNRGCDDVCFATKKAAELKHR